MVIILVKQWPNNSKNEKSVHSVILFDAKKKEKIFETVLTNQGMIGRIKSGLYQLAQGHIYFNNDVIKIRMDLIMSE
jgi:hypothetical protein